MDITSENFEELYPEVAAKISTCSFIAFDEEMTGIGEGKNRKDDTPDSRYEKMVKTATKYSIIQFGLCVFHEVDGKLKASPYNFYLFPKNGADVVMSPSSIDFLRRNNMDFGKWISKGLTFVDKDGEAWNFKKFLTPSEKPANSEVICLSRQPDIDFISRNFEKLEAMLLNEGETEHLFEGCNPYLRRAIYQKLSLEYSDLLVSKTADNKILVRKPSADQSARDKEEARRMFLNACGFRAVFKDIIDSRKPVVGHNCLFDLMFMLRWFDAPLSNDLSGFKAHLHELLPVVFDTKFIASSGVLGKEFDNTMLSELYSQVVISGDSDAEEASIEFADGFDVYAGGEHFHDAAWDAYCTGAIFAKEVKMIGGMEKMLEVSVNRLFMMQSLYHMDLDPSRPNGWIKAKGALVHLSNFPLQTTQAGIVGPFLGPPLSLASTDLEVFWFDGTSCAISVCAGDRNAADIVAALATSTPSGWKFQPYDDVFKQGSIAAVSDGLAAPGSDGLTAPGSDGLAENPGSDAPAVTSPRGSALMDAFMAPVSWLRTLSGGSATSTDMSNSPTAPALDVVSEPLATRAVDSSNSSIFAFLGGAQKRTREDSLDFDAAPLEKR